MKKKILVTILTLAFALEATACTDIKDLIHIEYVDDEATETESSKSSTEKESTEKKSDEKETDAKEESDKKDDSTSNEATNVIQLKPSNIPLVSKDDGVPNSNLYFQYEGKIYKDYIDISTLTLINGNNKATANVDGFLGTDVNNCTRLVTDDKREYIYFEIDCDNDYYHLFVFDITKGKAKFVNDEWFSYTVDYNIKDANNIELGNFTELLCMFTYHNTYKVGPDGMPVPKDDIYTIQEDRTVTSKVSLELEVVDENGNSTGTKKTIPEGSTYMLVHVYKDCALDAKLDDGTIVRIPVNSIDCDAEYNGKPLNELFSSGAWD